MGSDESFPRELTSFERELLLWVLPEGRPGYVEGRRYVEEGNVAGYGRRGEGNYILSKGGRQIDVESPLPQILAYGVVESEEGAFTISVREPQGDQLDFELVHPGEKVVAPELRERRRWTYSEWLPGQTCPACGLKVREVIQSGADQTLVLALCVRDQRMWVYDSQSGVSHPIPVTAFYNELMVQKRIHDPAIALDSKRLFTDLNSFSDAALINAFSTYNRFRNRVALQDPFLQVTEEVPGWIKRTMLRILKRKR